MKQQAAWQRLKQHHATVHPLSMRVLFAQDAQRFDAFSLSHRGLLLDFSKNRITEKTLTLLIELAHASGLEAARTAMFSGEKINWTEERPVLHHALRNRSGTPVRVNGSDVMPDIHATLDRMRLFSEQFRSSTLLGHTGRPLRTLVNIGIGGSHLGPELILQALRPYAQGGPEIRFVANMDGTHFVEEVHDLEPETTLFVIASKTFSTRETQLNAQTARQWLLQRGIPEAHLTHHFVAVTANTEAAMAFGVAPERIFPVWAWVGGRYSWCSAIGLSSAVGMGFAPFLALLEGAHAMDRHFCRAPLRHNMPVLLALIGLWNRHFLGATTQAILPYDHALRRFPAFLQQCDMESNGKRVDREGRQVPYATGPILWGEPGTNNQHSFFQLLHQGTHCVPVDFIGFCNSHHPMREHHIELMANFFAQSEALMLGSTEAEARAALHAAGHTEDEMARLLPHRIFPGNQPSNTLLLEKLSPFNLGMLISLYEMKIFVQGVVWRINSFDQWGVELGKTLAERVLHTTHQLLSGDETGMAGHDGSTQKLLRHFVAQRKRQGR